MCTQGNTVSFFQGASKSRRSFTNIFYTEETSNTLNKIMLSSISEGWLKTLHKTNQDYAKRVPLYLYTIGIRETILASFGEN